MRLHRFTAASNQKAMFKISEMLGPEALIYSTRSVPEGVEVVAGLPYNKEDVSKETAVRNGKIHHESFVFPETISSKVDNHHLEQKHLTELEQKIENMNEKMRKLSAQFDNRSINGFYSTDDDQSVRRNHLYYYLSKLGFRGTFCHEFINDYLWTRKSFDIINEEDVSESLLKKILTESKEFIDEQNICALIGPTGVGKTTTIAKLAKRYSKKYGPDSIGLITTDYHDLAVKNQLIHYSNTFNIDLEYANSVNELTLALDALKDKKLILIDTHGVSQRDTDNVTKLLDFLESQGNRISSYLTLPCNVQEQILDEIARVFKTTTLRGCILTKQDECISIAPAVSITMTHKLPIAYVCGGQDVSRDIECVDSEAILYKIMKESVEKKKKMEEHLVKISNRCASSQEELRYECQ